MKTLLLLLISTLTLQLSAQRLPDMGLNKVRLSEEDRTVLFEVNPVEKLPKPKSGLNYFWYGSGVIQITQGGYSGRLLNGSFEDFYLNKNLRQKGNFVKGLKNGLWKAWDEQGALKEEMTWNKGKLSGAFSIYEPDGKTRQTGQYQDGALDGWVRNFNGKDSIQKVYYDHGVVVPDRRSLIGRLNIFKHYRQDSIPPKKMP